MQADISLAGGEVGAAWLDIFVRGDIDLMGEASGAYAVHSNGTAAGATGSTITIHSAEGRFTASRRAVQANATASGGNGGAVDLQAELDIELWQCAHSGARRDVRRR